MSFPRYPEYKDSGVEWLGEVPSDWSVIRFRYCFRESQEKIENEVVGPMLSVSGYRGIEIKEYDDENRRRTDDELAGYRIVRPGQLVVNTMWLNYAGLGVSEHEGHVSPAYRSYYIREELHKRFVHHLMRSEIYVKGYTKFLTGVRPNSLQMSREDLMDFPVVLPSEAEQSVIAAFLDRETGKIDALVAEQEKLIALLKEKRQAVISHAVTKGLNPDAPMKPSGIEWLGDVPAHWRTPGLSYVSRISTGSTPDRGVASYWGGDIPWIKTGEVDYETIYEAEETISRQGLANSAAKLSPPGTLLMAMYGQGVTRGRVAILGCEATYNQACAAIELSDQILPKYALYFFMAAYDYVRDSGNETSQMNLSAAVVGKIKMLIPPVAEQREIISVLEGALSAFERLSMEADSAVTLLQERRSALISAAVTGQIDVRGLAGASA